MAFTGIDDACALLPAPQRDLLIRLAVTGVVRVRWTGRILGELFRKSDAPPGNRRGVEVHSGQAAHRVEAPGVEDDPGPRNSPKPL